MKTAPIQYRSVSKGEFSDPPPKPNRSYGSGLHPSFIAMVRAQPFSGQYNENPCHHLHEFKPKHLRHDTKNTKVDIVSLLSHGEGEAMVHIRHRKCE
jgi:hypothetical protein